ncbi:hypothetical protein GGI20_000968 [Coemansia sp. BCRC 34301]|nr:hypothetical protein GGI20_000968 [Coemansia sp. BCRC 34301]
MQEETTRTLASLSLGGGRNRSSVVDRVKWIEQAHGGGPPAQGAPGAQPRARLRLPKHFTNPQAEASGTASDALQSPKAAPAGLLSPRDGGAAWGGARLPPAMTQQKSSSKTPTLTRRTELMPSPVISEASTVAPADEVAGAVVENAFDAPLPVKVGATVAVEPDEPETVESAPIVDANEVDANEADAVEPELLLPPVERPASQTEPTHSRMPSEAPSTVSDCSSNITDPDDPVHVASTMGGAEQQNNNNNNSMPDVTTTHYATLPRSTKFAGSKVQGLGGTRNRPQQAPRRYDRAQPTSQQRPESSASMQSRNSEDSGRSGSAFARPKANEQPAARSFSTRPAVFSNSTPPADSPPSSLLARLNSLSATRPNVQDMVSNGSSPKFVKRSMYYASSSQDDAANSGFGGGGPRNRSQRRFR